MYGKHTFVYENHTFVYGNHTFVYGFFSNIVSAIVCKIVRNWSQNLSIYLKIFLSIPIFLPKNGTGNCARICCNLFRRHAIPAGPSLGYSSLLQSDSFEGLPYWHGTVAGFHSSQQCPAQLPTISSAAAGTPHHSSAPWPWPSYKPSHHCVDHDGAHR